MLLLYLIFNGKIPTKDWLKLNVSQVETRKQRTFECIGNANFKNWQEHHKQ